MSKVNQDHRSNRWPQWRGLIGCITIAMLWLGAPSASGAAAVQIRSFVSPEQATDALVTAARADRTADLLAILGPDGRKLIFSGDPVADRDGREEFVAAYDKAHKIETPDEGRAVLVIGEDEWPLPIPIVRHDGAWRFESKAGEQEILNRRIGRNELSAIEVCRAYVDAQREYATKDRNHDGLLEYARKFVSSKGKRDGLYWPATAAEEASPLGPLVASARAEGYGRKESGGKRAPYHGYYYRILTGQGKDAPSGAHDYLIRGHMIGGFALVAFPARYGSSGVMTFIVNQDGVVYQKNLGPNAAKIARTMTTYNPDASWKTP